MKLHRHAWFFLLVTGSAFAQEPPPEGPPPPHDGEPREGGPKGPERDRKGGDRMEKFWKMADTDGDGFISSEEFAALDRPGQLPADKRMEFFGRLDKNKDGRIGPDEMPRRRQGGMPPLEQVDANKDGKIDFEEFQRLGFVARLPEERQREMFRRMDHDHDGVLTPKDRMHGRSPRDGKGGRGFNPAEMIKALDTDGDGALSFEEFRKSPFLKDKGEDEQEDRFEAMDRNDDLKIDAADFPPKEKDRAPDGGKK
ncbi:EF-hand domain-containing protein [Luteolibacter marinus]|uniref:EF-hand domain-containing protein n=1 Tax=Luteolibacter marinus TaxID=2776705 RepID=UPI001866D792|nr:EF-hand domain-containing protein [Luteolibacter marinus]